MLLLRCAVNTLKAINMFRLLITANKAIAREVHVSFDFIGSAPSKRYRYIEVTMQWFAVVCP